MTAVFRVPRPLKVSLSFGVALLAGSLIAQIPQGCKERAIVVGALDVRGLPVKNLAATDFNLSYRGRSVTVTSSQYRENPAGRVVLLFDVSGSMRGVNYSNKWGVAHAAALDFVSSAPAGIQISFRSFSGDVQQRFEASGGRQPIQDWLASSAVGERSRIVGSTALLDTILATIHELSPPQPGDAIYVITDGEENNSKVNSSRVERSLLDSGTRLFAFVLNENLYPSREEQLQAADLDRTVRRSGGLLARLNAGPYGVGGERFESDDKSVMALRTTTRTFQSQIKNFYILTIEGMNTSGKQKDLHLDVVDAQGHRRTDIIPAYTARPISCPQ